MKILEVYGFCLNYDFYIDEYNYVLHTIIISQLLTGFKNLYSIDYFKNFDPEIG